MNRWPVPVLLALSLLASCGGGDGQTCATPAACGGEIAPGRYKITSYCASVNGTIKSEFCPAGIAVNSFDLKVTGTMTFNADKTYSSMGTVGATIVEVIPAECLMRGAIRLTCEQLTQSLRTSMGMSGSCTGSGACTCTLTIADMPSMASGTYSTGGTSLTITPAGGDASVGQYCATPNQVSLSTTSMGMMGMPDSLDVTGQSTTVFTKE
jgi:hypothetical protein